MSVTITLRGRHYTVRSDEDSNDVVAVAQWLDAKLSDMAARTRGADGETVALLVALNIASDFQRFRNEILRDLEDADRVLHAAGALLDAPLPAETSPEPTRAPSKKRNSKRSRTTEDAPVAATPPVDSAAADPTDLPVAVGLQVSED
jgi:cell division protein ZapA (FtsZ GTPase activity inhibitor)